jgi:DNA repair ATPase RecN
MPRDQVEAPLHDSATVTPRSPALDACDEIATALAQLNEATDLLGEFAAGPSLEAHGIDRISQRLLLIHDVMQKHLATADRAAEILERESHRPATAHTPSLGDGPTEYDLEMAIHAQHGIFEALDWIDSVEIC